MTNTALRAENSNSRTITFKSREHEKFYEEYLKKCRYQDVYHRALVYCLDIDRDTRNNVNKIYNFIKFLQDQQGDHKNYNLLNLPHNLLYEFLLKQFLHIL